MPGPERTLSKSKFSMYLRAQCDRELYLSLFNNNATSLAAAGIPIPLKSRPGVQIITQSGREFEREQFDELNRSIPDHIICEPGFAKIDLSNALELAINQSFILQPSFEPEEFRNAAFDNLEISEEDQQLIPKLSGLIPDLLFIREPVHNDQEILPDGSRKRIEDDDRRLGISVIDLKNITEANASYSAEVCLYAFFLANWLAADGNSFRDRYYVSDHIYLWKHVEMPEFNRVLNLRQGQGQVRRIEALLTDLEDGRVEYLIFMPSVRKFFKEDVPKTVRKGDTEGWRSVDYHVNTRCGSCDWLGNPDWLVGRDREHYENNPDHYCFQCADVSDHLSKMASLSKGAIKTLSSEGHEKIEDLIGIPPQAGILKKHTLLKRDRRQIGARAESLSNGTQSIDNTVRISGLASNLYAEYDIIVNFDSGSGLLTGIALRGVLFSPYGQSFVTQDGRRQSIQILGEEAFVVPADNENAEWTAVQGFIDCLSNWIRRADSIFQENGWGNVRTQICFWEPRQYEELCNGFGRHLLRILDLDDRRHRALAWLFPSDELMERDRQIAPGVVFVKDLIGSSVHLPVRFVNTLLSVAEHYHHTSLLPRIIDRYYREPLSNAIPRERIFEIWKSTTGTVRILGRTVSIVEAIGRYGNILKAHTWALSSITAKLRSDFRGRLEGTAPVLPMSIPGGIRRVAYDSKLWAQWESVSAGTARTEALGDLVARAERLESSYKAIILTDLITDHGRHQYEFSIAEESTEAKLEEGDLFCVVGIVNLPGFPLQNARSLGLEINHPEAMGMINVPMHNVISASIEEFDRINRRIKVAFRARSNWVEPVFSALMNSGIIPIGTDPIYLMNGLPYDPSDKTLAILRELGNPRCSVVALETRTALGVSRGRNIPGGTDPDRPMAQVLWNANELARTTIRSDEEVLGIMDYARTANNNNLNQSQLNAVSSCSRLKLSVIWGPPGTGKTDTLVAMLNAFIAEANNGGPTKKILISGPNYRTVEELSRRLLENLNNDNSCSADFFWVYSKSRQPARLPDSNTHLNTISMRLEVNTPNTFALQNSLSAQDRVTIISTTAHVVSNIPRVVFSSTTYIHEIFDAVIIDESSQVPVPLALRPLSLIKNQGQVIVAGDHLQMPPIHNLDPPKNAEYLVGSIQTYLLKRFEIQAQELLVNYRSNQDIVDFAKTLGYPPELRAFNEVKQLTLINDIDEITGEIPEGLPITTGYSELLLPDRRVTALIHEDIVSSQANEVEAKLVAGLAFVIRHSMAKELSFNDDSQNNFTPLDDDFLFREGLGIVTPHKAQKALVIRELSRLFPDVDPQLIFEAVDTVERFQGGQRQTIIVSFGVGDTELIEGEEAFLLQLERTNVAVSRAKAKSIILMPKSLAYHLPTDQKAAKTAIAIKSYIEEFCSNSELINIVFDEAERLGEVRWH
ncbi:MAG: ATP-binding protein [Bacteroidia bacterium]|nr:ATP-binding protein [Bacteroidia bacterium]